MAERRAKKYLADIILMNPHTIYRTFYRKKNILAPLTPALMLPEVTDVSKWWQGKHYYSVGERVTLLSNSTPVSP